MAKIFQHLLILHGITSCLSIIPLEYCTDWTAFEDYLGTPIPQGMKEYNHQFKKPPNKIFDESSKNFEIYDFIVIGSGPAGSVIANRLTENPEWKVLLLEIGEVPTNLTEMVVMANLFQKTGYNWGYKVEPQPNVALGLVDGAMNWPRGRVLGGSSTINACIHIRGNRRNFDRWALAGNRGWSFAEILPYFKKSEDFLVKLQDFDYHRQGGYLGVDDVPYRSKSADAFVEAMQEFGYGYVDYNGAEQIGVSYVHGTIKNGRRSGAYNAYIKPFSHRTNLKVYTEALATRILINDRKEAYGVKYFKDGVDNTALASKEIIISAGCFNSPQLLMLSGIGPRGHLENLGIPVVQDLPVGQNLYDHVALFGLTFTLNESITIPYNEIATNPQHMEDFLQGKGILTTLTGTEALGIVKTSSSEDLDPFYPDVELIFIGTSNNIDNGTAFKELVGVRDDIYEAIWGQIPGVPAATILPMIYHPKSRGYLQLKSKNPFEPPRFYANYLSDPLNHDVKTLISSVRMVQELIKMPSFQKYGAKLVEPRIAACMGYVYDSDEFWECLARHLGLSANHQVGTCKMGPEYDPEAVVDPELKVYGIEGLRVADTSIVPTPIAAHTNIVSFMIGEKLADVIKELWQ